MATLVQASAQSLTGLAPAYSAQRWSNQHSAIARPLALLQERSALTLEKPIRERSERPLHPDHSPPPLAPRPSRWLRCSHPRTEFGAPFDRLRDQPRTYRRTAAAQPPGVNAKIYL